MSTHYRDIPVADPSIYRMGAHDLRVGDLITFERGAGDRHITITGTVTEVTYSCIWVADSVFNAASGTSIITRVQRPVRLPEKVGAIVGRPDKTILTVKGPTGVWRSAGSGAAFKDSEVTEALAKGQYEVLFEGFDTPASDTEKRKEA